MLHACWLTLQEDDAKTNPGQGQGEARISDKNMTTARTDAGSTLRSCGGQVRIETGGVALERASAGGKKKSSEDHTRRSTRPLLEA